MQQGQRLLDMFWLDEAGADVLSRPCDAGVAGVQVEVARRDHVARDHRALEEVDVLQRVGQTGHVVEVLQSRFAVGASLGIDDVDRRARSAEVHPRAAELHVEPRVGRVQDDVPRRLGQGVLDEGARDHQAALVCEPRPGRGHQIDAAWNRVGEADLFEHVECGGMDPPHLGLGQGMVAAAGQTRTHRPSVLGNRGRAQLAPSGPTAPPAGRDFGFAHRHLRSGSYPTPHPGVAHESRRFVNSQKRQYFAIRAFVVNE